MTDDDLRHVLLALNLKPRRNRDGWMSLCPAHDDGTPSLSSRIAENGKLLLYCHAGCQFKNVLGALGLNGHVGPTGFRSKEPPKPIEPSPEVLRIWSEIRKESRAEEVVKRERMLGIPAGGLVRLGAAWAAGIGALAAPMMTAPLGKTIGVRLRADDGKKWAVTGSMNGLFVPTGFVGEGPLYMPEGLTDTASLVGLGLDAVGRPSCNGGRELARSVAKLSGRLVVVVTDADAPGRAGADLLASELDRDGVRVKVMVPPPGMKDVREFVRRGADARTIGYMEQHTSAWTKTGATA